MVLGLVALATVGGAALVTSVSGGGLDRAIKIISLTAASLALAGTAGRLVRWAIPAGAQESSQDQVSRAKELLASTAATHLKEEAKLRGLDDPAPIPVRWFISKNPCRIDRPVNLSPEVTAANSDNVGELADQFRKMKRSRLVLLGGPGSGKTTLAMQIVRELLKSRTNTDPVPLLLSLSSWDPSRQDLAQWIQDSLDRLFPALGAPEYGPNVTERLAGLGEILPVLDGLDEMNSPLRAEVILELSGSLAPDDPIILTSRTHEYDEAVANAGDVITSATVLESQPLSRTAAADYLARSLSSSLLHSWEPELDALRRSDCHGPEIELLAALTSVPFSIWLLRQVVEHGSIENTPDQLLDPQRFGDARALKAHLLDALIPALVEPRRHGRDRTVRTVPHEGYDSADVRRWLGFVAFQLQTQGTSELAWWKLAAYSESIDKTTRVLLTAVVGVVVSWLFTPLLGMPAAVLIWRSAETWQEDEPGYADISLRGRKYLLLKKICQEYKWLLGIGIPIGLLSGLFFGWDGAFSTSESVQVGVLFGLCAGLSLATAFGVVAWAGTPSEMAGWNSPRNSLSADRRLTLVRGAMAAAIVCMVFMTGLYLYTALSYTMLDGLYAALAFGMPFGLLLGIPAGILGSLAIGVHHAWPAYIITTRRMAKAGFLPRSPMKFFEEAQRLGLFRSAGPVYQFRHIELQEYLAAEYEAAAVKGDHRT